MGNFAENLNLGNRFLPPLAASNKPLTALFWHFIKISLNKMWQLFRGKVDYPTSVATKVNYPCVKV